MFYLLLIVLLIFVAYYNTLVALGRYEDVIFSFYIAIYKQIYSMQNVHNTNATEEYSYINMMKILNVYVSCLSFKCLIFFMLMRYVSI